MNAESALSGISNNTRMPIKLLLFNTALEVLACILRSKGKKYD